MHIKRELFWIPLSNQLNSARGFKNRTAEETHYTALCHFDLVQEGFLLHCSFVTENHWSRLFLLHM